MDLFLMMVSTVHFNFKLCARWRKIMVCEISFTLLQNFTQADQKFSIKKNPVVSINPYTESSRFQLPEKTSPE